METSHPTLMSSDLLMVPAAVRLGRRTRRTIAVNVAVSVAAKAAVVALAAAWRPVLWAAVLADVGTCLLVVLHSMTLLREPGTRRGSNQQVCHATPRSLAMRSQIAEASNGAKGPDAGCHCCQKPRKLAEQAHSVVIDIPAAASSAEHQEIQIPHATAKGDAGGRCSAGEARGSSTVTSTPRALRQCCARKEDSGGSVKPACCSRGEGARDSCKEARQGCRDARCCSGGDKASQL